VNSNHLLVPFPGKLSHDDPRDAFNLLPVLALSSCRKLFCTACWPLGDLLGPIANATVISTSAYQGSMLSSQLLH
jgi:hypothetical protein